MKYFKIIIFIICTIGFSLVVYSYFLTEFKNGWCVSDYRDGYIWHINNFSLGKYKVMGWQDGAWGNEEEMDKNILERKDNKGIQIYHQTACPEYIPN